MVHWKTSLQAAVSPLNQGVQPLRVRGFQPPGKTAYRPRRTAAVLVPILDQAEPELVLTLRSEELELHPGQVSFPGGAAESGDNSAVETAMREAFEEIGIPESSLRPIGFLDRFDTISDYRVLPVVALVHPPVEWVLDRSEVADVFTVPLSWATDLSRYRSTEREYGGVSYTIWSLTWREQLIWGATAAIIRNLAERMQASRAA